MNNLKKIANQRRLDVLELVYAHGSGHIGGSMSCMDILVALYYAVMDEKRAGTDDRDRFVLSKGHNAEALYTVLADRGTIDRGELNSYVKFGTRLAGHPTRGIPGVEFATGALGHGLPVAVGMALGLRANGSPARVYVLSGDGELAEGSNWEAMMAAAKYGLDNLTLIIDRNRLEISGSTEDVMPLEDLESKLMAFGFSVQRCNGHDIPALCEALTSVSPGKPTALIADTVKGRGSAVMENQAGWHHRIPSETEYAKIRADLLAAMEEA